jgi:hypothetical protein
LSVRWQGKNFPLETQQRQNYLETLHDEAQGGKLAAAVAYEFVRQMAGKELLQAQRLEPGEDSSNPQVQF